MHLTPHSFLFSHCDHLSSTTYILRVLSQETLEASKEVKYSFVPSPSLAKEVQYTSLSILSIHRYSSPSIWRLERRFEVFSNSVGQLQGKKCSIFSREAISTFPPFTGFIVRVIAPFCNIYFRVSLIIFFLVAWPNF
jgi:hypothetical protein